MPTRPHDACATWCARAAHPCSCLLPAMPIINDFDGSITWALRRAELEKANVLNVVSCRWQASRAGGQMGMPRNQKSARHRRRTGEPATRSGGGACGGGGARTARRPAGPRRRPPGPPSLARGRPTTAAAAACTAGRHRMLPAAAAPSPAGRCTALAGPPSRLARGAARQGRALQVLLLRMRAERAAPHSPSGVAAAAEGAAFREPQGRRLAVGTRLGRLRPLLASAAAGCSRGTGRLGEGAPTGSRAPRREQRRRQSCWMFARAAGLR